MRKSSALDRLHPDEFMRLAVKANFDAVSFAILLKMNLRTLERHFKQVFGCSPREGLERLRLAAARTMAEDGFQTEEIARTMGYKRASHLATRVRQTYGVSLQKFKKRRR